MDEMVYVLMDDDNNQNVEGTSYYDDGTFWPWLAKLACFLAGGILLLGLL